MKNSLSAVAEKLKTLSEIKRKDKFYKIPKLWKYVNEKQVCGNEFVNPLEFYADRINLINELSRTSDIKLEGDWTKNAVIYNLFVRYGTAYDHYDDGIIENPVCEDAFRETGTFLKAIAILPYLYYLGINTIYLLPITSIGKDGKKGTLGSPYAIKNPYKIDEQLSEPFLELPVETQFKAFVEAAHSLGMKVVLEFVFRTASLDSDWAIEHPEWFYWLKRKTIFGVFPDDFVYHPPKFQDEVLNVIKYKVYQQDLTNLPAPSDEYKKLFTTPPNKVELINGKIVGQDKKHSLCTIPSAFADWPPDDNQPLWTDVTYLKLYDHKDFNYIAYNTVRMYDEALNKGRHNIIALWDKISGIVPYYIKEFEIDGVLLDMGHSLPSELRVEIVRKARRHIKDFVFWEENFVLTENSVKDGYNATVGYLPFDEHLEYKMREFIRFLSTGKCPLPYFATPENHNTPRAAWRDETLNFSKLCWAMNNFFPNGIPFLLNGFELGEAKPINTGLCFTQEQIDKYPPENLPLFSEATINWDNKKNIVDFVKQISEIRRNYFQKKGKINIENIALIEGLPEGIVAFTVPQPKTKTVFMFAGNISQIEYYDVTVPLPEHHKHFKDLLNAGTIKNEHGHISFSFKPYHFYCGEIS